MRGDICDHATVESATRGCAPVVYFTAESGSELRQQNANLRL